ncbi:hypothetical protein M5K25_018701 [Dendrobium thyrsiflorum]|uniref:Myb-like domain-containing protein n=1 Tax=Dendrobium thyrsiflorum TaxID=117978 RepID=A0ABD0UIX6_DENTH
MMMPGGNGDALGGRMAVMPLQLKTVAAEMSAMTGGAGNEGGGGGGQRTKEDKVSQSQWGQQETRELIAIRADFERDFTVVRRNKTLWEAVSLRMRDKGYQRSPDQCKCKWKNLINRYKTTETGEAENGRHCPFFEEIHSVLTEHPSMRRLLLESEAGTPRSKKNPKRLISERLYDELSDDDEDDEEESDQERPSQGKKRKAEKSVQHQQQSKAAAAADKSRAANSIHELLQDFMQKQQQIESHWWEMMERRAFERRRFEQEWRQSMEKLEMERLMLERAWREREEQRRVREECRAEKRDALLNALLNKLIQNDL